MDFISAILILIAVGNGIAVGPISNYFMAGRFDFKVKCKYGRRVM